MKENYFDNPNTDEEKKKRRKKKKKSSFGKNFLMALGMIVIALAAFVITVKILSPDFDFTTLLPKQAVSVFNREDDTTVQPETLKPTVSTTVTTTVQQVTYLPIEDFKTDDSKKGNQLGNILNGGLVGSDLTYIYHIVNGDGIYRFNPSTESYARLYKTADRLSSLNLRGEYMYFVNERDGKLYRLQKNSQKTEAIAEKVKYAYVYDTRVYYVTTDNRLCVMGLEKLKEKTLYNSVDENMELVGVSLKRVFFTLDNVYGGLKFMTVDIKGGEKASEFRNESKKDEVRCPVLVNGFLYSYVLEDDGSYSLCRRKFGSENAVKLVSNVSVTTLYPVTDNNRLFYSSSVKSNKLNMCELNMNSGDVKVMLSVSKVSPDNTLTIQHGDSYDFIIGKKSADGKRVYCASGMYTGSTNVMNFKDGNWSY